MPTVLFVCWAILGLCILGIVIGAILKIGAVLGSSITILIIDIILGFGATCNLGHWKGTRTELLVPDEIAKSQYTMFVKCQGTTYAVTDVRLFSAPESSIRVIRVCGVNAYGNDVDMLKNEVTLVEDNK